MSLVSALEEYLKDPNFEQNRVEYRASKLIADKSSGGDVGVASSSSSAGGTKTGQKVSFAETKKPEKGAFEITLPSDCVQSSGIYVLIQ